MKTTFLFSILPLLLSVAASPQATNLNTPGAARECLCPTDIDYPACRASSCECRNNQIMTCWLTRPLKCNVSFVNCPAAPITKNYPRCGQIGLPSCAQGRFCRQIDGACKPGLTGCVGVCVPQQGGSFTPNPGFASNLPPGGQQQGPAWGAPQQNQPPPPQQGSQGQPGWFGGGAGPTGQQAQQPAKAASCPKNYACPDTLVCVQDPHDALAASRGPTFKCVDGGVDAICAGFQNKQCQNGDVCVSDPRIECFGAGCTGLCA